MLPSTFRSPVTCAATNGDALSTCCHKAKNPSRRPAAAEFFTTPLCVQDTAAVLLLKRPTCLQPSFLVSTIPSNTSYARRFPAIPRSFIYKTCPGFFGVISLAHSFFGHSKRQIVGSSVSFTGIQPTPTTSPDASTQPRNSGFPITNYFAVVGSRVA